MTLLPTDSQSIEAIEGPDFKVGPNCATPFCDQFTDHAHHIVRRSFLGGDVKWVRMPDGLEIGNLVPLCYLHHQHITENRCRIVYEEGKFLWDNFIADPIPLTWQPPVMGQEDEVHLHESHVHQKVVCESCGRPLPKPRIENPTEEKKLRKTWAVMVPDGELENGADVLDELVEAARQELDTAGISYGEGKKVKYYPLATAMALFVQHADKILSDS